MSEHCPAPADDDSTQVSSGLNLWLELRAPQQKNMEELLGKLYEQRDALHAALEGLHYVHFARFLPSWDWSALQVITSFDGDFDAYVMDFVLAIGEQFEMMLSYVEDRPRSPIQDYPAEFLKFIRDHDISYRKGMGGGGIDLYSAYPSSTVIDVEGAGGCGAHIAEPVAVAVDRADVQANVLRSVRARHACYVPLRIDPLRPEAARAWLAEMLDSASGAPQVSNDASWAGGANGPDNALSLGFTYAGLLVMGITDGDAKALEQEHKAFFRGPADDDAARAHGDVGDSDPSFWKFGGPHLVHVVVLIQAQDFEVLSVQYEAVRTRARAHGLSQTHGAWHAKALSGDPHPPSVHFGYVDGSSQPRLAIQGAAAPASDMQPRANVGEFLLGAAYPNVYGGTHSLGSLSPALAQNATFAALRIMAQDVVGFERLLDEASAKHGVDKEWLAAKIMGRWRDGTPVSLAHEPAAPAAGTPATDAFDYLPTAQHPDTPDDSAGLRCPVGAHVRRMNPRSAIVAGRPHSRRLLRRGMPYGPAFDPAKPDDGQERGLVGLFLCADLDRQYEFILRQWAQGDRATAGIRGEQDPILGAQESVREGQEIRAQYRIPMAGRADIVLDMPRLVTTVGSVYLFMPGLAGLRHLVGAPATAKSLAAGAAAQPAALALAQARTAAWLSAKFSLPVLNLGLDLTRFDPRDPLFRADPFPVYREFRQHHRVARLPTMNSTWVFGHAEVAQAASQPDVFRKRKSTDDSRAGLLNMDPPPHPACRMEVEALFRQVLKQTGPGLAARVAEQYALCRGTATAQALDWIEKFAKPVAHHAFFELLGLPFQQNDAFMRDVEIALVRATPADDKPRRDDVANRIAKLGESLYRQHRSKAVDGRLYSLIQRMTKHHDEVNNKSFLWVSGLQVEQTSNALTLILAGVLPLQWFIAVATWRLLQDDGALLRQLRGDASITNEQAVDELLRYDMSTPMSERYAAADGTRLGGLTLQKDERVMLCFTSANRDEAVFGADADQINFKRNKGPGFAFGYPNERSCLGRDLVLGVMVPVIQTLRTADPVPRLEAGFEPAWGAFDGKAMFRAMTNLKLHC